MRFSLTSLLLSVLCIPTAEAQQKYLQFGMYQERVAIKDSPLLNSSYFACRHLDVALAVATAFEESFLAGVETLKDIVPQKNEQNQAACVYFDAKTMAPLQVRELIAVPFARATCLPTANQQPIRMMLIVVQVEVVRQVATNIEVATDLFLITWIDGKRDTWERMLSRRIPIEADQGFADPCS